MEKTERIKTGTGKWITTVPDHTGNYTLYEDNDYLGCILFDPAENWIYDGDKLWVIEQEEIAGFITGHTKEMHDLLKSLDQNAVINPL